MKPKEAANFYEAERTNISLSHSDFSIEEDNDYKTEKKEVIDYLLSKSWDELLDSKILVQELKTINFIFEDLCKHFAKQLDSVEIFSLMTDFYDIDYSSTFNKLIVANRKKLIIDLEKTSGQTIMQNSTFEMNNDTEGFQSSLLNT